MAEPLKVWLTDAPAVVVYRVLPPDAVVEATDFQVPV
jgi:hypothetical protein